MDGFLNIPLFLISSILLIIAPGPDFIYVTTRGISEGNKAGLLSAVGISIGVLIHTLFVAFGLSTIIQASGFVYLIIKYVGAGYLIFLGIKILLNRKVPSEEDAIPVTKKSNVLRQGIITNVFNPKVIITFMAFLPQFVDTSVTNPMAQFIGLGLALSIMSLIWFSAVGFFAGSFGAYIQKNSRIQNWINRIGGSVMILLGLRLALQKE